MRNLEMMESFEIYKILKIRFYLFGEHYLYRSSQKMREDVESTIKFEFQFRS
jgi:hypothetical protein